MKKRTRFLYLIVLAVLLSIIFFKQNKPNNEKLTKFELNYEPNIYDYFKKYANFLKCKTKYPTKLNDDNSYSKLATSETHKLRLIRGITVYYPIEITNEFENEFRWLYRSWTEMLKHEPVKWRTDLIIFIENDRTIFNKSDFFLNQLNCSFRNIRKLPTDKPMCSLIDYVPIRKRKIKFESENKYTSLSIEEKHKYLLTNVLIFDDDKNNLLSFYSFLQTNLNNYGYVDSILMSFDGYRYFKSAGYDYLLRSDMDVFLTPMFAKWLPNKCNDFYVGGGAYSNIFNGNKLKRIAKNIGLGHAGAQNLGSSWYSSPDQFRIVSYLTLFCMGYLSTEEFSQPEREGKLGTILWPEWHWGVLLLYGQNLALNHLISLNQSKIIKIDDYLDYPSGNERSIFNVLHIHVFHGDDMFSKFQFKAGNYDKFEIPSNENATLIKYYALKMALEGKKTKPKDLLQSFNNVTKNKK